MKDREAGVLHIKAQGEIRKHAQMELGFTDGAIIQDRITFRINAEKGCFSIHVAGGSTLHLSFLEVMESFVLK